MDPRNSDSGDSHSSHSRSTLFSRSDSSSELNDHLEWEKLLEETKHEHHSSSEEKHSSVSSLSSESVEGPTRAEKRAHRKEVR